MLPIGETLTNEDQLEKIDAPEGGDEDEDQKSQDSTEYDPNNLIDEDETDADQQENIEMIWFGGISEELRQDVFHVTLTIKFQESSTSEV